MAGTQEDESSVQESVKLKEEEERDKMKSASVVKVGEDNMKNDAWISEYNNSLLKSKGIMNHLVVCAFSLSFAFAMRNNILVLYARTLDNYENDTHIGISVYLGYLGFAFFSCLFGVLGDKWRFDYLLLIASIIDVITFFIESISINFYVFSIAYIIGGQPMQSILIGFINKMLPIYNIKEAQMLLVQFYWFGYAVGPIFGGIIAYFIGYRAVFYISSGMGAVLLIYLTFYIIILGNSQTKLTHMQMDLSNKLFKLEKIEENNNNNNETQSLRAQNSDSDKSQIYFDFLGHDHIMPLLLTDFNKKKDQCLENSKNSKNSSANNKKSGKNSKDSGRFARMSALITIMAMQGFILSAETGLTTYYTTYIEDEFDSNVIISTCQVGVFAIFLVVGTRLVSRYIRFMQRKRDETLSLSQQNILQQDSSQPIQYIHFGFGNITLLKIHASNKYDFNNYLIINVIIGSIVSCIINGVLFTHTNKSVFIETAWVYMAFYGCIVGYIYATCEAILIELMPKHIAGKGFGIKFAILYAFKGITPLIIGVIWSFNKKWIFYVQTCCFAFVLVLVCLFVTVVAKRVSV